MKNYQYKGDGAGVAGLPHFISDEEAKASGFEIEALLNEAIKNGNYVCVDDVKTAGKVRTVKEQSNGQ